MSTTVKTGSGAQSAPKSGGKAQPRTAPRRVRRTGEEARRLILDAAEKRLATIGPEGIRLQEIAADVGISHPAILHHFQSRDGLVAALIDRTMTNLRQALLDLTQRGQSGKLDTGAMLDEVFRTLSDQGHARLLAWVTLTSPEPHRPPKEDDSMLRELTDLVHEMRVQVAKERGQPEPDRSDTAFFILLSAISAFGEAIVGRQLYAAAGMEDQRAAAREFRERLKELVEVRL